MPTYEITTPDGKVLEITAPEGATQEQVLAYAQGKYKPTTPKADFSGTKSSVSTTESVPGLKRDLGLSTRNVVEGAGDLVGLIADPVIHGWNSLTGDNQLTTRAGWGAGLDKLGVPRAASASERVQSDIGRALTGAALTMGAGSLLNIGRGAATNPTMASRVGEFLTAQPKLQAVSAATGAGASSVARESGYGDGAQLAAGLAGGLAPGALSAGAAATTRGLVRGRSGDEMQRAINDFGQVGATPSVGQASGRRMIQGVENLLAGAPTSSGVMDRFARKQAAAIGGGLQKNADDFYRNASGERAGRAVERGIGRFAKGVEGKRSQLYKAADDLIPQDTPVPMSRTRAALASLTTVPKGAAATGEQFVNPQIKTLADRIEKDVAASRTAGPMGTLAPTAGGLGYQTARDIRTNIGKELADFSLSTDRPTRQLKQVYAALSQDLEEAARAQGPKAAQAMSRANNYFKMSASRLDQLERVVDKNGGPEAVFNAAMAGTKDGGSTLRSVMQSLDSEGQRAMTGAVLKRMGLANAGQQSAEGAEFSAQTFLTNWNKLSPEARRALFDRHGANFSRNMDRVARVAENIKTGSQVFANPSGTANRAAALTYGGALVASLLDPTMASTGSLIAGGISANAAARLLTKPGFVRWLADSTNVPVGSAAAQISVLRGIGQMEGDDEITDFADQLSAKEENDSAN